MKGVILERVEHMPSSCQPPGMVTALSRETLNPEPQALCPAGWPLPWLSHEPPSAVCAGSLSGSFSSTSCLDCAVANSLGEGRRRPCSVSLDGSRFLQGTRTPTGNALNPQPSTPLSPQPSALSPQPSALSPQPSALSPQPSALRNLKYGAFDRAAE